MDVTPQLIEQIDFSEKFRGYDPDQVDDFLERVGATIAELNKTNRELLQRAERAEAELRAVGDGQRPAPAAAAPVAPAAVMSDEEEAMASTRTLMMAKRTADAAIADARQEAQKLVSDSRATAEQLQREAQTEADRIVGEARVNADQMTQKATAEASREYGARRDQILAEIGDLENRKVGMVGALTSIEARIEEYRAGLTSMHGSIGAILEDPEAMLRAPLPGLDLPPVSERTPEAAPVVETTSFAEPAIETVEAVEPLADPVVDHDTSFDAFGEPAFLDASPSFGDSYRNGSSGSHFGDATLLEPSELAVQYSDESTGTQLLASADLAWNDAEPSDLDDDVAPADPWGPGSWGEVSAFTEPSPAFSNDENDFFGTEVSGSTSNHAFTEFPSEGLPVIGQDRYTRDLDQAVNQPDESHDDAMTAFFEGDDDPQTRRFGRRR